MANTIRIAGAQIPINSYNISYNLNEIKKALDWAAENNVDIIQTPEASLSGYNPSHWMYREWSVNQDDIELPDALEELEAYQREVGVALNLGTCMMQREESGIIARNVIRHYDKYGNVYGVTEKTHVVGADGPCVSSDEPGIKLGFPPSVIEYREGEKPIEFCGMLCNDMWSYTLNLDTKGSGKIITHHLIEKISKKSPDLIFHSTNGYKFPNKTVNEVGENRASLRDNVYEHWHLGWLGMQALSALAHILTVDTCVEWEWDGDESKIDQFKTSSPSGVINPLGQWEVQAPRYGRQYFYYDFDLDSKQKYLDIVYSSKNGTFRNLLLPANYHGEGAVHKDFLNEITSGWE